MTNRLRSGMAVRAQQHAPALRRYPVDSPQAKARLIVLALFADGLVDDREVVALNRRGLLDGLGIRRAEFVQVLHDFCSDVTSLDDGAGQYRVSADMVAETFAEVTDRTARERLLQLMLSVMASDGELAEGERALIRNAAEAWLVGGEPAAGRPVRGRSMRRGRAMHGGA